MRLRTAVENSDKPTTAREVEAQVRQVKAILAVLESDANTQSSEPIPRHPVEMDEVESKWDVVRRFISAGGLRRKRSMRGTKLLA